MQVISWTFWFGKPPATRAPVARVNTKAIVTGLNRISTAFFCAAVCRSDVGCAGHRRAVDGRESGKRGTIRRREKERFSKRAVVHGVVERSAAEDESQ